MSRPADIPESAWVAAGNALDQMLCNHVEASGSVEQFRADNVAAIANAIMAATEAERERCSKIVDEFVWDAPALTQATVIGYALHRQAVEIAAALRKAGAA